MSAELSSRNRSHRRFQLTLRGGVAVLVFGAFLFGASVSAQTASPDPLLDWMNSISQHDLQRRSEAIQEINSVAKAEQRKSIVRAKLLRDIGGLPTYRGPLKSRVTGEIHTDSYTIEKVTYQSLPGFYITANVYRPNHPGRYPAVLLQAGHTQEGKPENQRLAANLARKGFVVLCFDPIGQGERVQTYSKQLDAPLAGWSVPEHIEMGAQAQLIGQGLARYFIWDAMRSIDYLASRPDVDPTRIGAAGCSGGGALTTFTGALDARLKVVIPGCFPSSFKALFATFGPDAEMVFPHFLASGLDTADFVEQSAPTPWLLQSTEHDQFHFTHEGVHLVYLEAQKWYELYGAQKNIGFMVGPGSHGMPLVSREAVYEWMIRWLKNGQGDPDEQPVKMFTNHELQVTPTGHVEDEPVSRKLHEILLKDFHDLQQKKTIPELMTELRDLKIPTDHSTPGMRLLEGKSYSEIRQQHIQFESDPGIWLDATLYLPSSHGHKPAVIMMQGDEYFGVMPTVAMAEEMAKEGQIVLAMEPRRSKMKNEEGPYTGDWATDLQANLIGENLPALRAHDILRGIDLLQSRADVDPTSIRGIGRGVQGIWLLLAAAADPRIRAIWLDRTPYSLRAALNDSMTADLWDAVIPGFALHWDENDLVKAMGQRRVLWTDPTNWMRGVVALGPPYQYRYVLGDTTDLANAQDDAYIHELLH
ncbi:MAG: acetylxylan esterase [Acidobacteriaceae bacterium]